MGALRMRLTRHVSFWQLLSKLLQFVNRPNKRAQFVAPAPVIAKRRVSQRKRSKRKFRGVRLDANSPILEQIRNLDR